MGLWLALLGAGQFAAAAEPESVRLPAELGDVTLVDGRTFRAVVVLSQTSSAINVRHGGGLTKIEKRQLPPEILARFPISEEMAVREQQQAQAAAEARAAEQQAVQQKLAEQKKAARMAAQKAAAQAAAAGAPAGGVANQAVNPALYKVATPAEQLAHAPKGLYITNWNAGSSGIAVVTVVNPTSTTQKMDPHDLVVLQLDSGRTVQGDELRFSGREVASNWVDAGQRKTFTVRFPGGDVKLAAIAWVGSDEWRVLAPNYAEAPTATSEDEAIRLTQTIAKDAKELQRVRSNQARAISATKEQEKHLVTK